MACLKVLFLRNSMVTILPSNKLVQSKIQKYSLQKKFDKQVKLFSQDPSHPSLNTELLTPKEYGVYSFRIDRKFRALYVYHGNLNAIEIINITVHYHS